ncbi:universal stress protein [Actinacidiphila sp. bgisy167]|uniref:universal stress protein n=1 Tax=Actinacidiphila sp. bgisy167 TaxID=3413797 RepID=UPI003D718BAE
MTRPVTVGLDGSPESHAAVCWAAQEALRRSVTLRMVHAGGHPYGDALVREAVQELAGRHPDLPVTTDVADAPPAELLVAEAGRSELLALGSQRLSGLGGFLLGAVGQMTLARAEGPVVVVRTGQEEDAGDDRRPVVLGFSLRKGADEVMAYAVEDARRRGARLRVVHAWSYPPTYGYVPAAMDPTCGAEISAAERHAVQAALLPWREKAPGVEIVEEVVAGNAAQPLVDAAAGAALLVVGRCRNRPAGVGPHLGPVAHAVLHHAACPVAVVPH